MPAFDDISRARVRKTRWYAAATQPHREMVAVAHLEQQGYEAFVPKRRVVVRHSRTKTARITAFFPGYVFVRFDPGLDRWRSINGTRGVRALVMQGDCPVAAPDGFVETLCAMTDTNGFFVPRPSFEEGDRVRLLSGPFRDLIAEVDEVAGKDRVRILLEIMNGHVAVTVDRSELVQTA